MLTGALGSGKTSLISEYLALPDTTDTGVIVNDAGEVNVDGAIIESGQRDLAMTLLSNGCICCSAGDNLKEAVDELLATNERSGRPKLRRIILETSGLAQPGPIIRSIRNIDHLDFRLRVVSTCDAVSPGAIHDSLPQYAAQLAAAQTIVLTKSDLVETAKVREAGEIARGINPFAAQILTPQRAQRAKAAFDDGAPSTYSPVAAPTNEPTRSHPRILILQAHWPEAVAWDVILDWLEDIVGFCGDRLLRAKGIITPTDIGGPLLINGVNGAFGPPRRMDHQLSTMNESLTIILRDTDVNELREYGKQVSVQPPTLTVGPH